MRVLSTDHSPIRINFIALNDARYDPHAWIYFERNLKSETQVRRPRAVHTFFGKGKNRSVDFDTLNWPTLII